EDQDGGESGEGADPGMRAQPSGAQIRSGKLFDLDIEGIDAGVEPGQQLKALVATVRSVDGQREGAELDEATLRQERATEGQSAVERDGVEPVLDHRAHAHQAQAVRYKGTLVAGGRIGNPDGGKAVVLEQVAQMARITPVRLRLAHDHGANLRGLADE